MARREPSPLLGASEPGDLADVRRPDGLHGDGNKVGGLASSMAAVSDWATTGDAPVDAAMYNASYIWKSPATRGFFRSRPVSRILSRVTISLCGVPGSSAGHVNGACFALHRTGFG